MKPDQTVKFLKTLGAENIQPHKRTGWIVSRCPLGPWKHDGGKSSPEVFGVKLEDGDAHTNCFSCGWHGSMGDLVVMMRHLNKQQPHVEVKWAEALRLIEEAVDGTALDFDYPDLEEMMATKREEHVFPEWWLDSFNPWDQVPFAVKYLQDRNVPASLANELNLRADTKEKRVCFPVRDFKGQLRGLHGRAILEDTQPRYRMYLQAQKNNPIIWLGEDWVDLERPIVVVEGPFDVTAVKQVYPNVVSPLFVNPSYDKLQRMADALEWVTFFDRGVGGDTGRRKVDRLMGEDHIIHHVQPPTGRKDPGACTPEEIYQLLQEVIPETYLTA